MAEQQREHYDSLLTAVSTQDAIARGNIAILRAEAGVAAQATLEAQAATDVARAKLAKLNRPATTDSTNPEWQRIANQQAEVIEGQAAQIVSLNTRVTKLDAAYRADSVRAATWQAVAGAAKVTIDSLATEVGVAAAGSGSCKILFWKCPSRKATALAAIVVTVAGFVIASKKSSPLRTPL